MLLGDQLGRRPRGGFVVVMESFVPARIEPTYRPSGEQRQIVLYAGDLDVKLGDQTRRVKGQLELRLAAGPLVARFAGPPSDALQFAGAHEATASVSVPVGASLVPPLTTMLPKVGSDMDWIEARIPIRSELSAGELAHVRRFIFHISGALKASSFPRTEVLGGGSQQQLRFRLPGWDLVIAPVDDPAGERDFAVVVDARPVTPATGVEVEMSIDRLISRLFILLSFISSREIGVGPVCGLSDAGELAWAKWGSPRLRPGTPGVRWCSRHLVAKALPEIAQGFTTLSTDEATEAVVERAIQHLLAADGTEALDVRVPIACSGLEMLGWARGLEAPKAADTVRRVLRWADVCTTIPGSFDALAARRDDHHPGGDGPAVVIGVRNRLVHPPKNRRSPEWPSTTELCEAWQLATWYLELVVLRMLGYMGHYGSRLRLGRYDADVEPVPWSWEAAGASSSVAPAARGGLNAPGDTV